jgi:hypothetical protein
MHSTQTVAYPVNTRDCQPVVGGSALTWWTRDAGTEKWKDSLEYKAACNGLSTHTFGSATSTGGPASPPRWFVGPFQRHAIQTGYHYSGRTSSTWLAQCRWWDPFRCPLSANN